MTGFILHPKTTEAVERLLASRPHAAVLEGPAGSGKRELARYLAAQITGKPDISLALREVYIVTPEGSKAVSVEQIRSIEQFLSRKLPGNGARVVIIESAHGMGREAQNALLKTLEEPPADASIILLADSAASLLPTVRSRAVTVRLLTPDKDELRRYYVAAGHDATAVERAILMSGGLPGLVEAILTGDEESELTAAAEQARAIIQGTRFQRLALVDGLSKQRDLALHVCQLLQQMAHVRLAAGAITPQWQRIMQAAYTAEERLHTSGQPKLVLTDLMLNL
ncbi:MAG TPA: hypothetical protein VFH39_00410 [Candidatus Saccharimonadales bacterium]|nr:hypothetical protein [Candidatus Saccharimonadales bacterium]